MKNSILIGLLLVCCLARADCPKGLPLNGFTSIANCDKSTAHCVAAGKALYEYMEARQDDNIEELFISMHGSPWHVYDADLHILDIGDLAALVRQQGDKIKRVTLLASWSGIAPDKQSSSIAQKLSAALGGMPVTGEDGFLWFSKDGSTHTTRQAATGKKSGPYYVAEGQDVMASLAAGWPVELATDIEKRRDAFGYMRAGVGYDIFILCPERALLAFDAGAALGNPIAAYNAAMMRLERGNPGDGQTAIELLTKAAELGDGKAKKKLESLQHKGHPVD